MLQMIKDLPKLDAPKKIRIKFSKGGELIYISHLDLVRTMTRAIVRSRIPVKYTEGYNPIPKLTFATPLSVGCASECEYLDIKIDREMTCEQIKNSLSAQLPPCMSVVDVYEPQTKFTEALYSTYSIRIFDPSLSVGCDDIANSAFDLPEIVVLKRSKSGDKLTDIKPLIKKIDAKFVDNMLNIDCMLCVSSAEYLNPEYIVNIVYEKLGLSKDNYSQGSGYEIIRRDLFAADMITRFK